MENFRNYMGVFIIYITTLMSWITIFTIKMTMIVMFNIISIERFFTNMTVFCIFEFLHSFLCQGILLVQYSLDNNLLFQLYISTDWQTIERSFLFDRFEFHWENHQNYIVNNIQHLQGHPSDKQLNFCVCVLIIGSNRHSILA